MEKKELKKLELKKQKIVELSETEASRLKGGTIDSFGLCAFEWLENHSYWCWGGGPAQPTGDNIVHVGPDGQGVCAITEVNVYGVDTFGG